MADGLKFPDDLESLDSFNDNSKVLVADYEDSKAAKWFTFSTLKTWISGIFAKLDASNLTNSDNLTAWTSALNLAWRSDKIGDATTISVDDLTVGGYYKTSSSSSGLPDTTRTGIVQLVKGLIYEIQNYYTNDGTSDEIWVRTKLASETYSDWSLVNSFANGLMDFTPMDSVPYLEGRLYYDDDNKTLTLYDDIEGTSIQLAEENIFRAVNDETFTIEDGQLVYISGDNGTYPTVKLANAANFETCFSTIGMATYDIETGERGKFTRIGTVNGLDTSLITSGSKLYLSTETDGAYTSIKPSSPNYTILIGTCSKSDDEDGSIEVQINVGNNTDDIIEFYNGSILENHSIAVSSDGINVTLTLSADSGTDLSLFLNAAFVIFDTATNGDIVLTSGTDEIPQLNYIYISESTELLAVSTISFPTSEQFIPIATVMVQSAVGVQSDGCYKVHAWTDHLTDSIGEGHLQHINKWIRSQPATYLDGIGPTTTIVTNSAAIDNVYFSSVSGTILQLHEHTFPAMDTLTDLIYVVNDYLTAYNPINDLSDIDTDSEGNDLRSNNTYYSLVVWGVVSEDETECKLFVNVPSGSYANETDVINDASSYSDYSIPAGYTGTSFLIARISLAYETNDSGTFTIVDTERLLDSTSDSGGGTAVSDHNALSNLQLAQDGVTYGHVDDAEQTFAGLKAFNEGIIINKASSSINYGLRFGANTTYKTGIAHNDTYNRLTAYLYGTAIMQLRTTGIYAGDTSDNTPALLIATSSDTVPTVIINSLDVNTGIGGTTSTSISLIVNNISKLKATLSDGVIIADKLGVGTSTPLEMLHVAGNIRTSAGAKLMNTGSSTTVPSVIPDLLYETTGLGAYGTSVCFIANAVLVGQISSAAFRVYSSIITHEGSYSNTITSGRDLFVSSTGEFGYISSIRESKINIEDVDDTSWVHALKVRKFNYRKKDKKGNYTNEAEKENEIGLVYDEIEEYNTDVLYTDEDGTPRGVNYSKFIPILLKENQLRKQENDELKSTLADLLQRISNLESK